MVKRRVVSDLKAVMRRNGSWCKGRGLCSVLALLAGLSLGALALPAWADFDQGLEAFEAGDHAAAFRYWQNSADQGVGQSQFRLAQLYEEGLGTAKDPVVAYLYYALAADQGEDEAGQAQARLTESLSEDELALAQKLKSEWMPIPSEEAAAEPDDTLDERTRNWLKAAEHGQLKTVKAMLEEGVEIDARDKDGWTALMLAALRGHNRTVQTLIEAGADITIADGLGMTALMAASVAGDLRSVKLLIKAGADVERVDSAGETAEYMAEQAGHIATARYLASVELPEEEIEKAQSILIALGYLDGKADGKSGPKTMAAVKAFQRDHGLKPTGLVRSSLMQSLVAQLGDAEDVQVLGSIAGEGG